MKVCKSCNKEYPHTEFAFNGYLRNQCRLCKNEQTRLSRQKLWKKHPEKHEAYKRKLREIRLKDIEKKREYDRLNYLKNKERIKKERKEFYHKFPELVRKRRMMTTYKISEEKYEQLNAIKKCQCCGRNENEFVKGLSIDHCHKSGEVRGVLCPNCNTAIGLFNDDPGVMKKAIGYLNA
jgi:hypothetical protein